MLPMISNSAHEGDLMFDASLGKKLSDSHTLNKTAIQSADDEGDLLFLEYAHLCNTVRINFVVSNFLPWADSPTVNPGIRMDADPSISFVLLKKNELPFDSDAYAVLITLEGEILHNEWNWTSKGWLFLRLTQ